MAEEADDAPAEDAAQFELDEGDGDTDDHQQDVVGYQEQA